ncbi:MAG: class I SAM-dependent rRNA methyltransferase [Bacteroidia bacterium]|nr:class I SAM-dependent rRNA methyltransferase [Bacteroidia bacterium]
MNYPQIILGKGKEFSLQRRHPWVFSGAIAKKDANLQDGETVEVFSNKNEYLATGYYAGGSIAVRIISFEQRPIDAGFWLDKIKKAWDYRSHLNLLNETTNVCRLFFGEGDGVPGLIIDYYNGHAVLQAHSWGVYLQKDNICEAIKSVLGNNLISIYDKSAETLSKHHSEKTTNGFLFGNLEGDLVVKENGHLFKIDFINGQKTVFFIDQRNNRQLLGQYCKGKQVLNTFSYTGGFSVYAAAAGASHVDSVDVSQSAIDLCNHNMTLNNLGNHTGIALDTFDFLKDKKDQYDVIVLDPPAFAKSRDSKHNAVQAYKRLNVLAMKLIKKNGILFTFSCSGVVDKFLFYNTITSAALECGRNIKVLHYLNQPPDHPVTPYFSEGEYLKGMVLWVE